QRRCRPSGHGSRRRRHRRQALPRPRRPHAHQNLQRNRRHAPRVDHRVTPMPTIEIKPLAATRRLGESERGNALRRANNRRRGATVVEFAITLPIFFLFLLAAFEFGWTNVVRHTADNAAYEAARQAMVPGATAQEAITKANAVLSTIGAHSAIV